MSNIMAAIGIQQLKRFKDFKNKRQQLANYYVNCLKENPNIKLLNLDLENIVMHIFPIIIRDQTILDSFRRFLNEKNIQTGIHYYPNHFLSLYKENVKTPLSITEYIYPRLLTLPLHPDLSKEDIDYIVHNVEEFLHKHGIKK